MFCFHKALVAIQASFIGDYAAEILFFVFKIAESMLEPSTRLFIYDGVCRKALSDTTMCGDLGRHPAEEGRVQAEAATYIMMYKILLNVPAIFVVVCCGAVSDRYERKIPVMLTCFGGIMAVLLYMSSIFLGDAKAPFLPMVLVGAAVRGTFGRTAVMTMSVHSYVTDISRKDLRTRKLGYLAAMSHFGYLAGSTLSGSLLDILGFTVVFCLAISLQTVCFFGAGVCMRNTIAEKSQVLKLDGKSNEDVDKNAGSCYDKLAELKTCFRVLTKPREGKGRCHLIILMVAMAINQSSKSGEADVTLLYVERSPLNWKKSTYSYLLATDYALLGTCALFILPLFVKCCRLPDVYLIVMGLIFKITRCGMLAFSTTTWMIFLSVVMGGPHSFMISCSRSMVSKIVDEDEVGKAFSLVSSCETVSNLLGTLLLTNIYAMTLDFFPGTAYLVEGGLFTLLLIMSLDMLCTHVKDKRSLEDKKTVADKYKDNIQSTLLSDQYGKNKLPITTYGSVDDGKTSLTHVLISSSEESSSKAQKPSLA